MNKIKQTRKVELISVRVHDGNVEFVRVAEILANHRFVQALVLKQELGHILWFLAKQPVLLKVCHCFFGLLAEKLQCRLANLLLLLSTLRFLIK